MQVTTENLKVGMMVTSKNCKGLMTVASISDPLESMPIQFRVGFDGIRGLMLFRVDEIWEVINEDDFKLVPHASEEITNNWDIANWEIWRTIHEALDLDNRELVLNVYLTKVPNTIKKSWDIDKWLELIRWTGSLDDAQALKFYLEMKNTQYPIK